MPRQVLPHLESLLSQIRGITGRYTQMLDDEFLFAAAVQVPQVATIFDRVAQQPLSFQGEDVTLAELLTLIAYRYGLQTVKVVGHGGYAVVLGQGDDSSGEAGTQRRVLRLVPEHHVRDITVKPNRRRDFDVRLSADGSPLRDPAYPLLLSDLFLLPRHTTRLSFRDRAGQTLMAGGYPAVLHCQLLPEVQAFNQLPANTTMTQAAGNLLEAALVTLGVDVADAHGGNGGILIGRGGAPVIHTSRANGGDTYIPVVIDYGYYSQIGVRKLAEILLRNGVSVDRIKAQAASASSVTALLPNESPTAYAARLITASNLPLSHFGRLIYAATPPVIDPHIWIKQAQQNWQTIKEKTYPPLQAQSRLSRLYPDYDEVIFPQRIEEYTFVI